MKKTFQFTIIAIFVGLVFVALILFASFKGTSTQDIRITLWGTESSADFSKWFGGISAARDTTVLPNVQYVAKDPTTFDKELVEAIASGIGPDAVILPDDLIVRYSDKIFPIPYTTLSVADFKNTYAQIGEIYLRNEGILALPFTADPLVMYWNRDAFNAAGLTGTPATWDTFKTVVSTLTKKDNAKNILFSGVAFGEYKNIDHAKDILSLLLLQSGSSMVFSGTNGYTASLNSSNSGAKEPANSAFNFYTSFANPNNPLYSWNKSLASSHSSFLSNGLALYFGPISEFNEIATQNPNLNFDVTMVPQITNASYKTTLAHMNGLAILKSSKNVQAAYNQLTKMIQPAALDAWIGITGKVPIRRDMLALKSTNPTEILSKQALLVSKTWLDPQMESTNLSFQKAVEGINSGKYYISEAVSRLNDEINLLLIKKQ